MKKINLTVVLLCLSTLSFSQQPADQVILQNIRTEGLTHSKVMNSAFQLADVAGPRLTNSPGLKRAQDWTVKQMKEWAIDNAYLESWGTFGKGWQVDKYYAATTAPWYHPIIGYPKAWTPGTNGLIKSEVILIKANDIAAIEQYKGKLQGKIILLDQQDEFSFHPVKKLAPNFEADASRFTNDQLLAMENKKPVFKKQESVLKMMVTEYQQMIRSKDIFFNQLSEEKAGLVLTNAGGSMGTFFTSSGGSYALNAKPVPPHLEVSAEDFQHLNRLLQAGEKVEIEAEVKSSWYDKNPEGYNVIAEIPGTDSKLKDEVVIIGAHLDSWHASAGATDNAAGSAVMMEVMRILKAVKIQPKRTIRMILWNAEEQAVVGSMGYVSKHYIAADGKFTKEQEKVSAYYNLDNGGGAIRGIYLQGNEAVRPIFKSWLIPFKDFGATTVTTKSAEYTDHQSFDDVNIPAFQFIQDGLDYHNRSHHSNQDTYDRLVKQDLARNAVIIASFVYHTAQQEKLLPRKK